MRVYLADLGHNQLTISSDVYPLGVANLLTYARKWAKTKEPIEFALFKEPQDLQKAIEAATPDILGLSSYSWNHNLSLTLARYAKRLNAKTLTVMGGPNYPLTAIEQESHLRSMPEIDIGVRGPTYEGERAFLNLLERYSATGGALEEMQAEPLAGSHWIHHKTKQFVAGPELERIQNLDDIPSPYLAGLMDPFLSTGYLPMMQITRGCPFTCSFCNSAVRSNSKAYSHSLENVQADLLYLAQRVKKEVAITFADDNFGMYELDEAVADYIAWLQENYQWPNYIRTTTGKNRGERIIKVMRKIRGALPMTAAVQSMNPVVLKNIERSNIKLETYTQIQKEVTAQGMQSYGEMILGLPGESKESFLKGIRDLMDSGVKRVSAHQLMLLHGAPLSNPDSRERFGMKTKFRVVARNIGEYAGEKVVETEEMVTNTPTLSFEDYLDIRVFHLLLTIFYYEGNVDEAFSYAQQKGIAPFDLIVHLQKILDRAPATFRRVIDDFVHESKEELFETREACAEWARQNFEGLVSGELGGNLLSKYSMLGRFYVTLESLDFLETGILDLLASRGQQTSRTELDAVIDYLRAVLLHVPFREALNVYPEWPTSFDVEAWAAEGYSKPLADYAFAEPRVFATTIAPERKASIETRIATYGEHASGLGKFTRTMFARDLRRTLVRVAQPESQLIH